MLYSNNIDFMLFNMLLDQFLDFILSTLLTFYPSERNLLRFNFKWVLFVFNCLRLFIFLFKNLNDELLLLLVLDLILKNKVGHISNAIDFGYIL